MRYRLAFLLLSALILVAPGCSESAADRDRDRVLAMIETLRPDVEAAIGDGLGEIEVTAVGEHEMRARLLATVRATSPEKLTRQEFEARFARQGRVDLLGGQNDPAVDVEGNLYFRSLPARDEELARNTEAALVRSYQIRRLHLYPFLRDSSGDEERHLRFRLFLRHTRFVRERLASSRGASQKIIIPGAGPGGPRCLANRTSRIAAAELAAWDNLLASYMEDRFADLPPTQAFLLVFREPPRSVEELTGLTISNPAYDLAAQASSSLWPRLTASVPTHVLPEVVQAQFLTAGPEAADRAGELVTAAFEFNAEHERGFAKVLVLGTGSAAAAKELEQLWLAEERALDEACRPGTASEALLLADHENVKVGAGTGTVVRRLEEDRAFIGLATRPGAWRRPERLNLVGKELLVVDLPYALPFPTDAVGVAKQILDAEQSASWPEPPADRSVEALAVGLQSTDPQIRWWSLDGIAGQITDDDPGWILLAPTLREERAPVLARSLAALGTWLEYVQFPVDDILPLLVRFCSHVDPEVRANAFRCLHHLESSEQGAEDALLTGMTDPVASVRCYALLTWSGEWTEANPPPVGAVPILIRMAKDPNSSVSWCAAAHLNRLDPTASAAVPLLLEALRAEEDILRQAAARALRGVDDRSPEVLTALQKVFQEDWSEEVTEEAWWSLKALTGKDLPWTDRFSVGE